MIETKQKCTSLSRASPIYTHIMCQPAIEDVWYIDNHTVQMCSIVRKDTQCLCYPAHEDLPWQPHNWTMAALDRDDN